MTTTTGEATPRLRDFCTETEPGQHDGLTCPIHEAGPADTIQAVNIHAALVAALRVCEQDLSDIANAADNGEPYSLDELAAFKGTAMAHAALAKAEGA